jgi:hypothetical protein
MPTRTTVDDIVANTMGRAAVLGVAAGAATALTAVVVSTAARCIDTPAFYNMWPLASGSVGVAAIVAGSLARGAPLALRVALIVIGVGLVAGSFAVAPFKGCAQFSF